MNAQAVLREDHGQVAVLTINRPGARNAIDAEAARALAALVAEIERDPAVQAAILIGVGDRAFCAGADLKELAGGSAPASAPRPRAASPVSCTPRARSCGSRR